MSQPSTPVRRSGTASGPGAVGTSRRSERPDTVKQRSYRHRNGITRSTLVPLVALGRVLETGHAAAAAEIAAMLGPATSRAAREAYRREVAAA